MFVDVIKRLLLLLMVLLFTSNCGDKHHNDRACSVRQVDGGAIIECPDSTSFIPNGKNGNKGDPGQDGGSIVFEIVETNTCTNNGYSILIAIDTNKNNMLDISDSGLKSATICNGDKGQDGQDGQDGVNASGDFAPVSIIDPCGDNPNVYDEVLLKLGNGQILASFSDKTNGQNTRFSILTQGNYVTTDGSRCYFTIDALNNVISQHY